MGKIYLVSSVALVLLAGCSGGGSSPLSPAHVVAPATAAPSAPASSGALATAQLLGAPGFVNSSQLTVYVFDADLATPNHSTCSGGCSTVWPSVAPPAGALVAPFAAFARGDGSMQLSYSGRALYTYVGDSQAGDTHGDGLVEFGGTWHIARPSASGAATPSPSAAPTNPGGPGY